MISPTGTRVPGLSTVISGACGGRSPGTCPATRAAARPITPAVAAIEVGRDNTYGHPTPSTLGALRSVPRVVRTDRDGTVRLRVSGGRMTLDPAGTGA